MGPLTWAQILLGHAQARRWVLHVQWFYKGITVLFIPHHTHTLLPVCTKAYFPVGYGLVPGKGGTTVYNMVRGYGEVGASSVGQCVENVRREDRGTQGSAQVDEEPDA